MSPISIAGAGPAGSAAALAALSEGAPVRLFEKSHFPRHKVCGEFLSPEIQPALESLGVWSDFLKASPARIHSVKLHFGPHHPTRQSGDDHEKSWRLAQPAFGLSRYRLDKLLLDCAISRGAELIREIFPSTREPAILAYGRMAIANQGNRLFGFKAHFTGPAQNAVELFVGQNAYAGVSIIEDGATNVCGLAGESVLSAHGFDIDSWIRSWPALEDRLRLLSRSMDWLITGPLVLARSFHRSNGESAYRIGDALGFIDPFTGSGILSAVMTGKLAGVAAARRTPPSEYLRQCARALRRQYRISSVVRFVIRNGLAETAARLIPGSLLFSLTRPKIVLK